MSLRNQIVQAAYGAGEIMKSAPTDVSASESKTGHANFVTKYDAKVQAYLFRELSSLLPDAHFVGEEDGKEVFLPEYQKGWTFVVDPIDGTSNFMKAYRPSVTSIGLLKDGVPYLGVIYNPYTDQMFSAEAGQGAFENEARIMSSEAPLSLSLVSMGTAPYYGEEESGSAFDLGRWYLSRSIDIRRSGSAAWDFCMTASGRIGLFFEPRLCLWDFTAGSVILSEAGGFTTDLYGQALPFTGSSSILAVSRGAAASDYLPPKELIRL